MSKRADLPPVGDLVIPTRTRTGTAAAIRRSFALADLKAAQRSLPPQPQDGRQWTASEVSRAAAELGLSPPVMLAWLAGLARPETVNVDPAVKLQAIKLGLELFGVGKGKGMEGQSGPSRLVLNFTLPGGQSAGPVAVAIDQQQDQQSGPTIDVGPGGQVAGPVGRRTSQRLRRRRASPPPTGASIEPADPPCPPPEDPNDYL